MLDVEHNKNLVKEPIITGVHKEQYLCGISVRVGEARTMMATIDLRREP
jgi:hypothetical protein